MAVAPIFPVLLLAVITRCKSDHTNGFNAHNENSASQFGAILKPPPPPQLAPIAPVPFHRGLERNQRQNADAGYQYQAPPPPPSPSEFKFPAPFYKQYNFNFVPPPQPFATTPTPSMFQKVSGWLFPSQQTSYAGSTIFYNNNNVAPIKKDCNPCNLVPWLPVIRYNVGAKSVQQNHLPTYGPPSPTAYADALKAAQKYPQPFNSPTQEIKPAQSISEVPHLKYGPPTQNFNSGAVNTVSSTYGPPSATHTLDILSPNPPISTFSQPSSTYISSSSSYTLPNSVQNSQFVSTPSQELSSNYNLPSSTYKPYSSSYGTPSPLYVTPPPLTTTYQYSVNSQYDTGAFNEGWSQQDDVKQVENFTPAGEQQVPKNTPPTTFKNSYGEPITNTHLFDISYPISAIAAESSKVKTQVSPHETQNSTLPNMSFALAKPAPFTLNRGRNIHTLQPVALPNLSVSPLPPIFNARPFRPVPPQFPANIFQGINQMQQSVNNVNIQQSIPLTEYTHSVDYPATIIQSPVIEIDAQTSSNQTKGYRNIPNSFVVDEIRDISSQASEDHISATKSNSDVSLEITGTDIGNELYDSGVPPDLKQVAHIPSNHKPNFADLRGLKDEDLDKYRTENNLQNIDSPLLYLKPSVPHKSQGNFILAISSPIPSHEYEIYDDVTTTPAPQISTLISSWDESRTDYDEELNSPPEQDNTYKPKIVQIIVPYTTGDKENDYNKDFVQMAQDWPSTSKNEYQARKVPSSGSNTQTNTATESYSTESSTTEDTNSEVTENYDPNLFSSTGTMKDVYDVKEPPFDIIKLQHTIDDWTEQEYSKQYKTPQRARNNEIYAKKIPDDYFTTTVPTNYMTTTSNNNYDFYDHEVSSSIQHLVTDDVNNDTYVRPRKEYNIIERPKNRHSDGKNKEPDEVQKLHIYTAASSFRTSSTTTTPAPWDKIQTSISPLTQEKVYVVTSKPWRESRNVSKKWYDVESFESKQTYVDSEYSASDNLPFKSPRFMNRPSFGFTSGGKIESDSSYGFSKSWYQSINELETPGEKNSTSLPEATQPKVTTNLDEGTIATTANPHRG